MAQEKEIEFKEAEEAFKNQMFFLDRKLYKKLYVETPNIAEHEVEWVQPQTPGEVAEALEQLREAGGPNLDFEFSDADDDWSFLKKLKDGRDNDDASDERIDDSSEDAADAETPWEPEESELSGEFSLEMPEHMNRAKSQLPNIDPPEQK